MLSVLAVSYEMKYHGLTALLLLALAPAGAASQSGTPLPAREEIARITIEQAPLHLFTTDYLLEALPCFTPAERHQRRPFESRYTDPLSFQEF